MSSSEPAGTTAAKSDDGVNVPRSRIVIASLVGTTIEFYDFYIYATAAISVFPLLFFPTGDSGAALLSSLATFGLAFVARPIGSVVFGHFGDRIGRKATLVGSLLTMGIATFLIGLLPTYAQIGLFAPAMLAILRFCQGLGLGGEWSGAALLATETAKKGKRAWAAMWPQLGAPFGFILANGFFLLLTVWMGYTGSAANDPSHPFVMWGWRIPFLVSAIIVLIGLYVRLKLEETPVFARAVAQGKKVKTPIVEVFRTAWKPLILGTFIMLATYSLFYLMTTWILSYAIGSAENGFLGIPYQDFLTLQLISIIFFAAFIPVAGWLADKFGRRRTLMVVTAGIIVFGLCFNFFLAPEIMGQGDNANHALMLTFLIIGMMLMGLTFGPMSAILPELFETNVRYTGSALAYNISSIFGAALAPFIAAWLAKDFGVGWVGVYLASMAVLTFVALYLSKETKNMSMDTLEDEVEEAGQEAGAFNR